MLHKLSIINDHEFTINSPLNKPCQGTRAMIHWWQRDLPHSPGPYPTWAEDGPPGPEEVMDEALLVLSFMWFPKYYKAPFTENLSAALQCVERFAKMVVIRNPCGMFATPNMEAHVGA